MQLTIEKQLETFCLHLAESERSQATMQKYRKEASEFLHFSRRPSAHEKPCAGISRTPAGAGPTANGECKALRSPRLSYLLRASRLPRAADEGAAPGFSGRAPRAFRSGIQAAAPSGTGACRSAFTS